MLNTIARLSQGERQLIVCIGDSITEQNYHLDGKLNYVGQFSEKLLDTFGRKHLLLNAGVSGDTTWGIVERLERDALRFKPDLLLLMIGLNDSTRGAEQVPAFRSNLRTIINRTREARCELLLLTQNGISFEQHDNVERRNSYPAYVAALRETAAELNVPLCDMYRAWEEEIARNPNNHWRFMDDGIHPNERGHAFMAQTLYAFLGI